MKTSPLFELHKSYGASFVDVFGVQLPAKFSESYAEHQAARHEAAIFDLSFRGLLRFSGEDRTEFLQGMLTNDIKALKPHEGAYAALLTAKGHMISDLRVLALDDSILIDLNSDKAELVSQTLSRYIISEDVEVSNVSDKFGIISIQGPKAAETLNSISQASFAEFKALKEHAFVTQRLGLIDTIIVKTAYTGEEGFDLIVPIEELEALWKLLLEGGIEGEGRKAEIEGEGRRAKGEVKNFGVKPAGFEVFNALRIEAGIPFFGIDMDESTIPLEAPLEARAISYTKGCYIGQEIVARLKYRGRANKFLVGLKFFGDFLPNPGDLILKEAQQIGKITSAVFSYSLSEKIGLGYVHRGFEPVGTELSVSGENGTCIVKVTELPFYKGERRSLSQ